MTAVIALAGLLLAFSMSACGQSATSNSGNSGTSSQGSGGAKKVAKVGVLIPGPKNDGAAGEDTYNGATEAAKALGTTVVTRENVATADSPQALRAMAQQGLNPIVVLGEEFLSSLEQVAPDFPKTTFINFYDATKPKAPNIVGVSPDPDSATYVIGAAAGLMTKTNKLGFVAGDRSAIVESMKAGWEAGAKSVNPNIQVKEITTGDFSDVQKNVEGARALIDQGVDVLMGALDAANGPVIKTAQNAGIMATPYLGDFHKAAPKAVIVSGLTQGDKVIQKAVMDAVAGKLQGKGLLYYGLRQGVGGLGIWGSFVPAKVRTQVEALEAKVAKGQVQPPAPK